MSVACQRQAMPSARNRRRAPFGGGAPQAAVHACCRSRVASVGNAAIRSASVAVVGSCSADRAGAGIGQAAGCSR